MYPAEQKANPVYSTNKYYISNFNNNSTTRLGRRKVNSGEREKKLLREGFREKGEEKGKSKLASVLLAGKFDTGFFVVESNS